MSPAADPDVVIWQGDDSPAPGLTYATRLGEAVLAHGGRPVIVDVTARPLTPDELACPRHILTGGATPATTMDGWPAEVRRQLREVVAAGSRRVVGICLGSQLLAVSLFGPEAVRPSPSGLEVGLQRVTGPSGSGVMVGQFHYHEVDAEAVVRGGGSILASNAHTRAQAWAADPHVRGIQFHPELRPDDMQALVRHHEATLDEFGLVASEVSEEIERREAGWSPQTVITFVLEPLLD